MIRTAASPEFIARIDAALGDLRVEVDDCGSADEPPALLGCQRERGVCARCADAPVGDPIGRRAVDAWRSALDAALASRSRPSGAPARARPGFVLGDPGDARGLRVAHVAPPLVQLARLFEARSPKDRAVSSRVDGVVRRVAPSRVVIEASYLGSDERFEVEHRLPRAKPPIVSVGERVRAGEPLCDGERDPHEVLEVLGERALAAWIERETSAAFEAYSVAIAAWAVALLVRAMLARVRVNESGGSRFSAGELVNRWEFFRENERLTALGALPARAEPALSGLSAL